jgi:hypothetical protein
VPTVVYRGPAGPAPMLAAMLRYEGLRVTTSDPVGQSVVDERGPEPEVDPTLVLRLVVTGGDSLVGEAADAAVRSVIARFRARVRKGSVVEVAVVDDA